MILICCILLKRLQTWLKANKISLNAGKTEFLLFRHQRKTLDFSPYLKISGKRIYPKSSVKYLGVYLDEHLNWHSHISDLSSKLTRANGILSKLRHYVPLNTLIGIYHALFGSHLQYRGLCDNTSTHCILILQKGPCVSLVSMNFVVLPPPFLNPLKF